MHEGRQGVEQLGALLVAQMERWAALPLAELCSGEADEHGGPFHPMPRELLAFLAAHRQDIAAWLEPAVGAPGSDGSWTAAPAAFLRRFLVRWIHSKNQFIEVDAGMAARIEALYGESLLATARALQSASSMEERLAEVTAAHRRRLRALLAELAGQRSRTGLREVVCAEYDPALQLSVLGLDPGELSGPVLDLGCGHGARLVAALRARGIAAVGLDRHAPRGDGIREGDWLVEPLGRGAWGAIVSHHAFSLHFLHHHLASADMAARHARRMLDILRALRPGGVFAYAPGLPFFEPVLERAGFSVTRVPVPAGVRDSLDPALATAIGASVAYGCQVRRQAR